MSFALPEDGRYVMTGTDGASCWKGMPRGFDTWISTDLENWDGPFPAFRPPEGFWSDRQFWAPEIHHWRDRWYMFATFKAEGVHRGTQILESNRPDGPYRLHSDGPVTPDDWECLDGTLHVGEDGRPWMVFCHEWVQVGDGEICAMPVSDDLRRADGDPILLFKGSDAPWGRTDKETVDDDHYVTDGPFMHRAADGTLLMLWSSFGPGGYAIGLARSESGDIRGPWLQRTEPLYTRDGGHGMLFKTLDGALRLAIHTPNDHPNERPIFLPVAERDGEIDVEVRARA